MMSLRYAHLGLAAVVAALFIGTATGPAIAAPRDVAVDAVRIG